jgi:hypothetical protein
MPSPITRVERAARALAGDGVKPTLKDIARARDILTAAYPELMAGTHCVCPNDIWIGIIERTNSRRGPERIDPEGKIMSMIWQPICDEFARMRREYGPDTQTAT